MRTSVERLDEGIRTRHRPPTPVGDEAVALGIVTESLADHVAAADPHTQYQKESEKGAVGGYASLDGGGTVPDAQLPAAITRDAEVPGLVPVATTAVQGKTKVDNNSGGDPVALTSAGHGAAADPHTQYRLESATIGTADLTNDAVTYAKMQDVSATDKVLGRSSAGAGDPEEIACTAFARSLLDDADAAAGRTTLGIEDGSWTPTIVFGGASVGVTYTTQVGRYTKIGNMVIAVGYFLLSNKGSSAGDAAVGGLPFPTANISGLNIAATVRLDNITFAGAFQAYAPPNASVIAIEEISEAGVEVQLNNTDFANTSAVMVTIVYRAA